MSSIFSRVRKKSLHLGRYGEILSILIRYGFGDFIAGLNIQKYTAITSRFIPRLKKVSYIQQQSRWERIRLAVEELGPTFIKLGQFMSNRPDVLPIELVTELEKLQDAVKPFSVDEVKNTIEEDLGRPVNKVFAEFSETPLASASIAQVHKARLADGRQVAVKVRRPRIQQIVETDIDILHNLAALIERHDERWQALNISQLVDEFQSMLEKELDFSIEAAHIERFRTNFCDDKAIHIPALFPAFTTKRVLVTEFIHGIKVSEIESLTKAGLDVKTIARQGATSILKQIFEHGYFHADPHPGNILVKTDGTICFLDFGAIGIIPPTLRHELSIILYSVVHKDPQRIVKTLAQLSRQPIRYAERLEYDIMEFIEEYSLLQLKDIRMGEILNRFADIITRYELKIIPGFYLLIKALIITEGVGRRLDPEFNMTAYVEPFVKKLLHEYPRLKQLPFDTYFMALDLISLIKDLPFDLKSIISIVKTGDLRIQFEHRGLSPLIHKSDQLVNRLVFAIVLASLIIGSSIVILSGIPPKVYDVPLIGVAGFLMAALIGFGIIFDILRRKKM
jgi:ubiquinone biosynthesis protein